MKISQSIVQPTAYKALKSDVEQKTSFTLDKCELNIFETHRKVENVKLTFDGFTITSMIRGKKVLHPGGREEQMNYLPGESYILGSDKEMNIDFPEANPANPTQCTALVIDGAYLDKQIEYINDLFPRDPELGQCWNVNFNSLWLQNDENIALLSNRLIRVFSGNDPLKDILVDIKLKELLLSIMRLQNSHMLTSGNARQNQLNERFRAVIEYIKRNVTSSIQPSELSKMACMSKSAFYRSFTNEFGIPPTKLVLIEKISRAKTMMANENMKIKEICFALGFSDPNYFSRAFKKIEGMSPNEYMASQKVA